MRSRQQYTMTLQRAIPSAKLYKTCNTISASKIKLKQATSIVATHSRFFHRQDEALKLYYPTYQVTVSTTLVTATNTIRTKFGQLEVHIVPIQRCRSLQFSCSASRIQALPHCCVCDGVVARHGRHDCV